MQVLISSTVLLKTINSLKRKEIKEWRIIKDGIEFLPKQPIEASVTAGCTTEGLKEDSAINAKQYYGRIWAYDKIKFAEIRDALTWIPEQPIVFEFDNHHDTFYIKECALMF